MNERLLFSMRMINPKNHLRAIEEMFSEVLEVSELPNDWQIDDVFNSERYLPRGWPSLEPGKFHIMRKLENRRDELKLKQIIKRHIQRYLDREKDSDQHLFKQDRLENIEIYQFILCKNRHQTGKDKERALYKDLDAYKSVLRELVPDDVTPDNEPKDRHPKDHPFIEPDAYEVFKFLADEYHNEDFVKWSVIFEHMKHTRIETHLSARKYLQWIICHYEPQMKSVNLQPTTDAAHEIITTVHRRYKKPT